MSQSYKYFVIPFEDVPANPSYTVWYATWSEKRPTEPGKNQFPMVVGVTTEANLPAGAVLLGDGLKDPPPPPPPPPSLTSTPSDYLTSCSLWLSARDEDE